MRGDVGAKLIIQDRHLKNIAFALIAVLLMSVLTACSGGTTGSSKGTENDAFAGGELADVSGYKGLDGYEKETVFVETSVAEVKDLMDEKETFVLFCGFERCPWCNILIPYLNDAALDAGMNVGYIDTRSNPKWKSNMDIDDYDVFTELFGEWLKTDEDGKLHLYVPDTYFIKDGKVVARYEGVLEEIEDPSQSVTAEQEEQIRAALRDEFASLR